MSELDWTNVKVVRAWLDKRYLVGNHEIGSPFFQYLKDELVQGKKIRGRETYLTTHELMRWLVDTQPNRAFHYSVDTIRTPYYPEYNNQSSQSRSQSPTQSSDRTRNEASNLSNRNNLPKRNSKKPKTRATTIPQKSKPRRKSKSAKKMVLSSLGDETKTKQSENVALLSAGNSKAVRKVDPKALRKQKERVRTLRPRSSCKRGETGKIAAHFFSNMSNVYSI